MKNLLIIIILIVTTSAFAQTIEKLDERNGFKELKLGDSIEKWKNDLIFVNVNKDYEKLYKYSGPCCKEVFSSPVENIELVFHNDKLIYIAVYLKPYEDNRNTNLPIEFKYPNDNYQRLLTEFKFLFGKPFETVANNNVGQYFTNTWEGKKVVMNIDYYFKGNYDYSKIILLDKLYYKRKKESGF